MATFNAPELNKMDIDLSDVQSDEPVSLTSRDRYFFAQLLRFMNTESSKVGGQPSKERFVIFRLAFEKIIEKSSLYRPLFRAIKQEYEQCINALESGAEEVQVMSTDLHRLVLQPKTFLLRQKRCMELEDKLSIIEQENRQLERQIDEVQDRMARDEQQSTKVNEEKINPLLQPRTGHRRVPGLTFAEETNLKVLENYRDFLREKSARLDDNAISKYTTKEKRWEMQRLFERKQAEFDHEREQRLILRNRLRLYHLTLRTIQQYLDDQSEHPAATGDALLEDVILKAIYQSLNLFAKHDPNDEDDFDSGSLYDREAGVLLNHIENFMDMMDRGNYKEASYIAACSPKGVLRNMETLVKFKALTKPPSEEISPYLFHCKVLAETALEAPFKPDLIMSLECAKAAINEKQLNLLYKWIAENRLTISHEMAKLVERANALDLAEFIFRQIGAHEEVANCLLKTDSSKRCMDYLLSVCDSIPQMKDLLTKLFHQYPTVKFAVDIIKYSSNRYFQADELVLFFLQMDQHFNGIQFVERLIEDKGPHSENEEAEKLKTCFDLLKKYSYLVDDKCSTADDEKRTHRNQTEHQLAHHLTEHITRSALDRFRRVRRLSNPANITLEPIEEHPTPIPTPAEAALCHQDFFNDFPGMLYSTDDDSLNTHQ